VVRFVPIAMLFLLIFVISCTGSDADSPVLPSGNESTEHSAQIVDNNRFIWGLYDVSISGDFESVEISPMRTAGMHFNTLKLLETNPCTDCITIGNFQVYNPGEISLDVTLRHPFPSLVKYTGFDVRGILMAGADYTFPAAGRGIPFSVDKPSILNADGYTQLFNPTDFPESSPDPPILEYIPGKFSSGGDLSATLNPYLAYCEDSPRRMFNTSGIYTRTLRLRIPQSGGLEFGYAVDASWHPAGGPVNDPVVDFSPEANCHEAYRIDLTYGWGLYPGGGSANVIVDVYDHQGQDTIESVTLEAPYFFDGEMPLTYSTTMGEECFRYTGVIENSLGTYENDIPVLVRVKDTTVDPNLGQIDGWTVAFMDTTPKEGWAVSWICDGEGKVEALDLACDGSGNEYVTGTIYFATADLDPGPGVDTHGTYTGSTYVSKFDSDSQYLWGVSWGGADGLMNLQRVECDSNGDVFVSGIFGGTLDFDPGPGEEIYTADNYYAGVFVCKYTSQGEYLWTKVILGEHILYNCCMELDQADNIYLGGFFNESVDFDPGPGEYILSTPGNGSPTHAYLCKLDSDGNFIWAHSWGDDSNNNPSKVQGLDTDADGNVYCTGTFEGTGVDFDPGPDELLLDSSQFGHAYLTVFDQDGNHQWAVCWGTSFGYSVAIDPLGFIYVGGGFAGTVDFDPGPDEEIHESHPHATDGFASVFTMTGNFLGVGTWERLNQGSSTPFSNPLVFDIEPDGEGNFYVCTYFRTSLDVDPGPGQDWLMSIGTVSVAVMKVHVSGEIVWARMWGYPGWAMKSHIALDEDGNIYGAGIFGGDVDFDPGPDTDFHDPPEGQGYGSYLIKLPPSGNW